MSEVAGQVMLIVGPSGVGKTYGRVQWFVKEFLADPENGGLVTNLPLNVEAIAEYYDRLHEAGKNSQSGDDIRDRIVLIDKGTLWKWKREQEKPEKFIERLPKSMTRFRLVIDEIGDYYSKGHSRGWQTHFQNFLDQVRHMGDAGVEMITQTTAKLPPELPKSVEVKVSVIGCKVRRDGAFNIPFWDWYQLTAIISGRVTLSCFFVEYINVGERFVKNAERKAYLTPEGFSFYDSHSTVEESSRKADKETQPFERYGVLGTVKWFLGRNWWRMVFSLGGLCIALLCAAPFFSVGSLMQSVRGHAVVPEAAQRERARPEKVVVESPTTFEPPIALKRLQIHRVTLIDSEGAVVDGIYYAIEETIEFGDLRDETIDSVDVSRGLVRFSDGSVGRLPQFEGLGAVPGNQNGRGVQSVQSRSSLPFGIGE